MERSSKLMTLAMVLYFLSLLEVPYTYVNGAPSTTGGLRGLSGASRLASKQPFAGAAASQLRLVAAGLAVSAACMSLQAARGKARVQAKAGPSAQMFASALITAAEKNDESVEVAKDMFSIKQTLEGVDADSIMAALSGAPRKMTTEEAMRSRLASSQLATMAATEGKGMLEVMDNVFKPATGAATGVDTMTTVKKLLPGMKSKTLDKFLTYVDKKEALAQLPEVCTAYTKMLYTKQSVAPVLVRSAQPLSKDQVKKITAKMQAKLGVEEIKLVTRVEASLIAGLQIEWDFADPLNYVDPKGQEDISFSRAIQRAVMAKTGQETLE